MKHLFAIFVFLAFPLSALAQSDPSLLRDWKPGGSLSLPPKQEVEVRSAIDEVTLGIRVPFLGGDLDNSGLSKKWKDLYGSAGGGFEAKYSHLFKISPVGAIGAYAGFTLDVFGGKTIVVDPGTGPETWDVDPWAVTRLIFGARVRQQWGAFFMDENIGFGPVFYSRGTASDLLAFNDIEIIQGSTKMCFELGMPLGAVVSRKVDLGLGMAWELNGAPERGRDLANTFDYKAQANFVLTFLINLNFSAPSRRRLD
jgi:hypothetical protein